jgi:hypothetical protein
VASGLAAQAYRPAHGHDKCLFPQGFGNQRHGTSRKNPHEMGTFLPAIKVIPAASAFHLVVNYTTFQNARKSCASNHLRELPIFEMKT